ncbi:MAG TPA: 4-hydroxy-tetrahydrodipicolinate reductase [Burkholderiaceae bacterium]|nr:4-hydroxy-tetrahydrodipicolinate reductase [Burkholderiaceae bacterium]
MKIAIAGSSGRMGRTIIEAALGASDLQIVAALDRPDSPELGRDCAEFLGKKVGIPIVADLDAMRRADVLIDFTRPAATLAHLAICAAGPVGAVIGTTGFDAAGKAALAAAAEKTALVVAPNMSVGVQAMLRLVELGARLLAQGYDIEILETHHRDKVDAPSGTALQLGEVAARARGQRLEACAVFARHGNTGPRPEGSIGFAAVRGGDVIGDHTVLFAGLGERIEITHRSSSRQAYALGALRAARFLRGRANGLYDMRDVLTQ